MEIVMMKIELQRRRSFIYEDEEKTGDGWRMGIVRNYLTLSNQSE